MAKIEYRTLNEQAYDRIQKGLVSGSFRPGQPLVIRALAGTYGISTTPIREALQRLVAERQLEMLPNRSIAVPMLSVAKFTELLRIRCELEGLAGELAATHIRPPLLKRLRTVLDEIDAVIATRSGDGYMRLNQKFHYLIYEQANSPILLQMVQNTWGMAAPFFYGLMQAPDFITRANDQHRQIVAALEAGAATDVRRHLVRDITVAAHSIMRTLPKS